MKGRSLTKYKPWLIEELKNYLFFFFQIFVGRSFFLVEYFSIYIIYKKNYSVRAHFYVKLPHDFSDMIPTHGEWFFGDQKLCQIVAVVQKKVKIESSNGFLWHVRDSVDENYFFLNLMTM